MAGPERATSEATVLIEDVVVGESPRWHDGRLWYGDVPSQCCVRVAEGGQVLQTINLDRGCFACMLGGMDGATLFMVAAQWRGLEKAFDKPYTGQVLSARAPAACAGWP